MTKTNSSIQAFSFAEGVTVRSMLDENNQPWFVAADVCKALEVRNPRDAVARLDDDERGVAITDTLGGKQEVSTINESGLYSLILTSRKVEAKRFKKWVTSEVLPSIRKTGGYGKPDPEFLMIHKSVLRDTGKALVWMGDYGVTSLPYRGQIPQYQVEGAVKEKQMISVPVEDWMTICNSVYAVYKVFGDALSYSINHNYQPMPATLSIPCSIASQANKAMGLIYTHTFRQVGGAA